MIESLTSLPEHLYFRVGGFFYFFDIFAYFIGNCRFQAITKVLWLNGVKVRL